jgi:hypothetical protein
VRASARTLPAKAPPHDRAFGISEIASMPSKCAVK